MRSTTLFTALCLAACGCAQVAAADPPAAIQPAPLVQPPAPIQPPAGEDPPKMSAPVTADAAPAGAPPPSDPKPAPPPTAAASASSAVTDAEIKKYRSKGYKPLVHDGTTVFCRSEATLGSRLERQVCRTAAQLDEAAREGQDMVRDVQRGGTLSNRPPGT